MTSETADTDSAVVYIVDDSPDMRLAIGALLESEKLDYRSFASAEEFLHDLSTCPRGVAVVDLHLPGRDGHDVLAKIANRRPDIRAVMVTGDGELEAAIKALRNGAADFVEKPFDEVELIDIIRREMKAVCDTTSFEQRRINAHRALASLSRRERQVVDRLADGQANKQIAFDLGLSVRTVEMYRKRGMERLGVNSFAELVQLTVLADKMPG
ncbi:response regulator transcription factor [Sphingomicrobium clamense]|uniref:Response regulator n=1 Tax=Sphingomicrobium clamense TaxID=2851013 RepID=A0ABS6V803_9SPHN|nr:response regulator [Sphingomicrobium sp. B8]MBW0145684.1 response regulator [Sphingomicrobium sp. B8]